MSTRDFLVDFVQPFSAVPWQVAVTRMVFALLLSGLLGWERERHHRTAGLRTYMMVALAACLFTLAAHDLLTMPEPVAGRIRADTLRLIGAVTSGAAFLGAGAIIRAGGAVHGLTTGSGLWLSAAIGLTCGLGNIPLALIATVFAFVVLAGLRLITKRPEHEAPLPTATDESPDRAGSQRP